MFGFLSSTWYWWLLGAVTVWAARQGFKIYVLSKVNTDPFALLGGTIDTAAVAMDNMVGEAMDARLSSVTAFGFGAGSDDEEPAEAASEEDETEDVGGGSFGTFFRGWSRAAGGMFARLGEHQKQFRVYNLIDMVLRILQTLFTLVGIIGLIAAVVAG